MDVALNVVMKKKFKDKIDWFSINYDKEIAGWIEGEIKEDTIILEDLLIPEQEADSGGVDMQGKALVKLRKEYGDRCKRIIGEWHSHHTMGVMWSRTDDDFIEQYANPRDISIFVVSGMGKNLVRIEIRKPFKLSLDKVAYSVETDLKKIGVNMQKEINKKVTVPENNYVGYEDYDWGNTIYHGGRTDSTDYQTEFKKQLKEELKKTIIYNPNNHDIIIQDVYWYYADEIMREYQEHKPTQEVCGVGEIKYNVTFKNKNKKEALILLNDVKQHIKIMFEEANYQAQADVYDEHEEENDRWGV